MASDILAIGMDHYFDQEPMQVHALKTSNTEMIAIFKQAKVLLFSNAAILLSTLALCPPWTWLMVTVFFGPAFVWDFKLLIFGGQRHQKKQEQSNQKAEEKAFSIKRIPGMKAVLIGIIRGCVLWPHPSYPRLTVSRFSCGTFAVVNSVLARSIPAAANNPSIWNPIQIIVWSTINRACHAVRRTGFVVLRDPALTMSAPCR